MLFVFWERERERAAWPPHFFRSLFRSFALSLALFSLLFFSLISQPTRRWLVSLCWLLVHSQQSFPFICCFDPDKQQSVVLTKSWRSIFLDRYKKFLAYFGRYIFLVLTDLWHTFLFFKYRLLFFFSIFFLEQCMGFVVELNILIFCFGTGKKPTLDDIVSPFDWPLTNKLIFNIVYFTLK